MKRFTGTEAGIGPASTTPTPVRGISHEEMAALLGISLEAWLATDTDEPDDDDDCMD